MELKLISLISLLLSIGLVSGRNYMDCSSLTNEQQKCVCFARYYTTFNSDDCGKTRQLAKDSIDYACKNNRNCSKGFVNGQRTCGSNEYGTIYCRTDCLETAYSRAMSNQSIFNNYVFGLRLNPDNEGSFLRNTAGNKANEHQCDSWRKEV